MKADRFEIGRCYQNLAMISSNYPSPITVNGFSCRNCTDVDYAKKNIDPANPTAGPFGMNDPDGKKTKPLEADRAHAKATRQAALAHDRANHKAYGASADLVPSNAIGGLVDIKG